MTTLHRLAATGAALLVVAGSALAAAPAHAADATFPPTANTDNYGTTMDVPIAIDAASGMLANDLDGGNAGLVVDAVTLIDGGTLTWNADGSFVFTPDPGFTGTAHLIYRDAAGGFQSDYADVWITVVFVPHKLGGTPDFYTTPMDTPFSTTGGIDDVILNDADVTYVGGIDDVTGEVAVNIYGKLDYTPAPGFVGTKTFSYYLDDGKNIPSDWILVTIVVTAPTISVIPSNPLVPGNPGTTNGGELPTLAYTGIDDVTTWLIAPALALVGAGALAVWFARRRAARA